MCYIELEDNIGINRKFVRLTNPTVALYFAELLVILKQVKLKNKFDPISGSWKLDRKYLFAETGIDVEEQKRCDQILVRLGISEISSDNPDRMAVNVKRYFELLTDETLVPEELLPKTVKMTAADQKAAKKAAIISGIVKLFDETDDRAVAAVRNLVEAHYAKGLCTHAAWRPIIQMLHACTTDPDGIVELIDYILATNYVSIPAAIDSFMKKHKPIGTKLNSKQTTCSGVMKDVEF